MQLYQSSLDGALKCAMYPFAQNITKTSIERVYWTNFHFNFTEPI